MSEPCHKKLNQGYNHIVYMIYVDIQWGIAVPSNMPLILHGRVNTMFKAHAYFA